MGVPALFRWLADKYPRTVTTVVEEQPKDFDGIEVPIDITKPNPNGIEFDNLYLDSNGIIHPCCHPEDKEAPLTEEDMMIAIFEYTDRIINMVRPRKLLYIAIDGVAPRAKMNQQRSRRFRAAHDAKMLAQKEEEIRLNCIQTGQEYEAKVKKDVFDSNCITPGTPFMTNLAVALRYYVAHKLNSDPGFKNTKVIISDASVPGEGEHKIMDYIRRQRSSPEYDPNTSHVLYGLDADLIMLALATHEPHFRVLREDVFFDAKQKKGICYKCSNPGHDAQNCRVPPENWAPKLDVSVKPYVFLHVHILREYLDFELRRNDLPFAFDLERAIDDWVFMCFFVGNDFLPHLPSLEIREGAIDSLVEIYKRNLSTMGGYLTNAGAVDLDRAQLIMDELAQLEERTFQRRKEREERYEQNSKRRKLHDQRRDDEAATFDPTRAPPPVKKIKGNEKPAEMQLFAAKSADQASLARENVHLVNNRAEIRMANISAAEKLRMELRGETPKVVEKVKSETELAADSEEPPTDAKPSHKRKITEILDDEEEEKKVVNKEIAEEVGANPAVVDLTKEDEAENEDDVRLWEVGFKERYYRSKFGVELSDHEFRRSIVKSYVEGLCWVLAYYFQGCPSWKWFYPYHFSPFASDFADLGSMEIKFELGKPFKPFEQLMGVLPAASKSHIPPAFQKLMTNSESPIIDFYPENFKIDMNGKKMSWMGVALLPWIDADRLLEGLQADYPKLTEEEVERNALGHEILYLSDSNPAYEELCNLYGKKKVTEAVPLNPTFTAHLCGAALPDPLCIPGSTYTSPLQKKGLKDIPNDKSLSVLFVNPTVEQGHKFGTTLLPGVQMPATVLGPTDAQHVRDGPRRGRGGRGRGRGGHDVASRMIRHGMGVPSTNNHNNHNGPSHNRDYGTPHRHSNDGRHDYRNDQGRPYYQSSPNNGNSQYSSPGQGGYYNSPGFRSDGGYSSYGGSPASSYGQQSPYQSNSIQSPYSGSPPGTYQHNGGRHSTYGGGGNGQGYGSSAAGQGYGYGGYGAGPQSSSYGAPVSPFQPPAGHYGHPPPPSLPQGGQYGQPLPPSTATSYPPQRPSGNMGWSRNVRR